MVCSIGVGPRWGSQVRVTVRGLAGSGRPDGLPLTGHRDTHCGVESRPSRIRFAVAALIFLGGGVSVLAWKFIRSGAVETGLVPVWVAGVLPNFMYAAILPVFIFATRRVVRPLDYAGLVVTLLGALCAYEFAQIWMPRRVFDWADLGASAAGAGVAVGIGWLVFFRWLSPRPSRSGPRDSSPAT